MLLYFVLNAIIIFIFFLESDIKILARQPGQLNTKQFYLGCDACTYHQAMNKCKSGYHLCSLPEITAGIYQHARTHGWLRLTRDVWQRADEIDQELVKNYLDPKLSKAGICCADSFYTS